MAQQKLPDKKIIELYVKGELSLREIGVRAGRTGEWVRQLLKRMGVPKRDDPRLSERRRKKLPKRELQRLYVRERLPVARIAARFGTYETAVRRELHRHGIPLRRDHPSVKHPELRGLKVGESVVIPNESKRPGSKAYLVRIYSMAKWAGIRVSVRSIDEKAVRVTRIASPPRIQPKATMPREEMIEQYRRPEIPVREIANKAGVSARRIRNVAREAGVPVVEREKYKPPRRRFDKGLLEDLYVRQKRSIRNIAAGLGSSEKTVRRELLRHGLLSRPEHEFPPNVKRPEIRRLEVGESVDLPRVYAASGADRSYTSYYSMARNAGVRVSIRSIDEGHVRVTRKG